MSIDNIVKRLNESKHHIPDEIMDVSSELHQKVDKEVLEYMKSEGFDEKEVRDYSRVDAYFDHLDGGHLIIEVGAEVSYDGLMELCDRLNPIVAFYDEESYFEPVTSGIISAWLDFNTLLDEGVYSPYDQSDRDNSDYNKSLKSEEESHPYVGKKVRWSEDGRTYRVTGAYDDSRGTIVRCGDITMRPGEYTLYNK